MTLEALEALQHKVKTEKYVGFNFTEYTIFGDLQGVLHELRDLFMQYHPFAYGSKVQKVEMLDDQTYRAVFWRGNSGD